MSKRPRLWNNARYAAYWESQDAAQRRTEARKYGEYTAAALGTIWRALSEDERAVLEYLLLRGRRAVVARYEDPLCNALVDRKLLQRPAGVGTVLMHNLETTFKIPRAVWREMCARKEELLGNQDADTGARLRKITARIGAHITA